MPELQPYRVDSQASPPPQIPDNLPSLAKNPPGLQIEGWLSDQFSTISLWWDGRGTLMEIPAVGRFWTAADGSVVCQVSQTPDADPAFFKEALLGPPLMLALALQGSWCLHASAVEYGNKVIGFLGGSGSGKSTLAAFLAGQPGVRRAADDILPVTWQDRRLSARPHFPQLKLPGDQQPGPGFPDKLPLAALYLLDEQPTISIEALGPGDSTLVLAGHTVAARLFDRQLLSRHFEFCSQVAAIIPIRRLAYPRIRSELPALWQALQDDMEFWKI